MAAQQSHAPAVHRAGNTVYLVTGSNRGIGLALVHQLLARPATTVVALHRPGSAPPARPAAADPSAALVLREYTAAQPSSDVAWLAGELRAEHGIDSVHVVVAGAGTTPDMKAALATPWAEVAACAEVNLGGPLRLAQGLRVPLALEDAAGRPAAWDGARERKFVLVSSSVGSIGAPEPMPGFAYGSSKAAANFLVARLHVECKDRGLCAVAVHPGWVKTRMGAAAATSWGLPEDTPPMTAEESAEALLKLIDGATVASAGGKFLNYDGTELPW